MSRPMLCLLSGLLFSTLFSSLAAQSFIGQDRVELLKELQEKAIKNKIISVIENGTAVLVEYNDKDAGNTTKKLHFDDSGKCNGEKYTAKCESCYKTLLQRILDQKEFEWKKINENQYISKFDKYLLIELPLNATDYSFTVFQAEWNKEVYKILSGKE